ncbi:MAG TPA: biotin/lipoyl-binding protein [Bdellovibrionales bacterium]|nr:biotin/lipoyl-binding protein [Bdellovibrionales bacterium]
MNWITVEFAGRQERVAALKYQGRLWFHWRGETHVVDLDQGRRGGGRAGGGETGVTTAPMPGKITKVLVAKGDAVKKGQTLVVMEAMKMEYTLEADREGKVGEVNVKRDEQVALGAVLVRVVD